MLETTIFNTVEQTKCRVELPIDFDELKDRFYEQTGSYGVDDPDAYEARGLSSIYGDEDFAYSYEKANEIAEAVEEFESEYGERIAKGFFEEACYEDVLDVENFSFYTNKEEFLNQLYDAYGLSDYKFLWTTVDMFLNDDYIFEQCRMNGNIREADNGVIVEG